MPVKIRLMRIGAKKRPFYRVVAVDEKKKRTGKYIELLGTYNPLTEPKEIILRKDRIDWWMSRGAVPSDGYLRIIKQAPQKPPRKPKKEKEEKKQEEPKETKEPEATEVKEPQEESSAEKEEGA
ncbi:MAG: 30S ribosomal protein S16 [Patescibacteria group bacterium]|nr:30S ribosomal protein S16 [Patescibacteria group bacterium]